MSELKKEIAQYEKDYLDGLLTRDEADKRISHARSQHLRDSLVEDGEIKADELS